ncbi:MAG: hypothetical protein LBO65_02260 [Spirochaetaceae bacterium]|jgi:hypothetical protein|nr:hypothetical protein [Spirochaetaceae bacterium]
MKELKKVLVIVLLAAFAVLPLSAQTTITTLEDAIDDAAEILGRAMITNSGLGLNWSDAYIGQLIGKPPHFGIGISTGFTGIPLENLDDIYKQFDSDGVDSLDIPINFLPLPTVAGEIRLGGFFLPFDIGIKALPLPKIDVGGVSLKYLMVGGDFRYALMQQEKGSWKPAISAGLGLTYTKVDLTSSMGGESTDVDLSDLGPTYNNHKLIISSPELDFSMKNITLDLKVQVSKKLFIITPYLGMGLSYGWSTIDFGADSELQYSASGSPGPVPSSLINDVEAATGLSLGDTSLEKSVKYNGFGLRGFGGLSFDIFAVRIDLTGLYDIVNRNWGTSLGIRVQI